MTITALIAEQNLFGEKKMIESITLLRNLAGLMFWGLADLVLGFIWLSITVGSLIMILKNEKKHD